MPHLDDPFTPAVYKAQGWSRVITDSLDTDDTSYEVGVHNGRVEPGDVVAIIVINSRTTDVRQAVAVLTDGLCADAAMTLGSAGQAVLPAADIPVINARPH